MAHLRDHGSGPWGEPGADGPVVPPPAEVRADGTGVTLCMHVRAFEATTASMVAELPTEDASGGRAWVALGSPCASVYVPVLVSSPVGGPAAVPGALGEVALWRRFAALGDAVERRPDALAAVRAVLGPIEAALWDEADTLGVDVARWRAFASRAMAPVVAGLERLAGDGLGPGGGVRHRR